MVDFLGEPDRGVPAGTITPKTLVECARKKGSPIPLGEAQEEYLPYACKTTSPEFFPQCPNWADCLALHRQYLRDNPVAFMKQAWSGLPRGNQTLYPE